MHAAALDFANLPGFPNAAKEARYDAFLEGARARIQQSISSVPIWGKVATSCGPVWQAEHKSCTLEMDLEKSQLYIMHDDHDGQTVSYKITPEGMDFLSCSGEDYCESWDDEDWYIVETSINF
jgi:hypothetical protein